MAPLEPEGDLPAARRYDFRGRDRSGRVRLAARPCGRVNSARASTSLGCQFTGVSMKCQQCEKQAVFHITELESGAVRELHLCEDHARVYLNQAEGEPGSAGPPDAAGGAAGGLTVGQTADELAALDQKSCDMCGITFFEFRNQGRLGCPHDYVHFAKELEPLIANVHGATEHTGRRPEWARQPAAPAGGKILPSRNEQSTSSWWCKCTSTSC